MLQIAMMNIFKYVLSYYCPRTWLPWDWSTQQSWYSTVWHLPIILGIEQWARYRWNTFILLRYLIGFKSALFFLQLQVMTNSARQSRTILHCMHAWARSLSYWLSQDMPIFSSIETDFHCPAVQYIGSYPNHPINYALVFSIIYSVRNAQAWLPKILYIRAPALNSSSSSIQLFIVQL